MYFGAGRKQQAVGQAVEPVGSNERKRASAGEIHREQKKQPRSIAGRATEEAEFLKADVAVDQPWKWQ
eukprot:5234045-Heterocapsa_arctica.AAC.1